MESQGKRNQKGTTLIELMIALTVLGTVVGSSIICLAQGFRSVEYARDVTRCSQILQTEMETLRTYNWSALTGVLGTSTFDPFGDSSTSPMRNLVCTRTITTEKTDQRRVALGVTWTDSYGVSHSKKYESIFTKEGLSDYYTRSF